jgi:predicted GTPase
MSLTTQFEAYRSWRDEVAAAVLRLQRWLADNDLLDTQAEQRLSRIRNRLSEDRLVVAFVAEFSRGKSELINALFFADHGGRVLPSSAGRTTMCPTEIAWQRGMSPRIALLPIETRAEGASIADLRAVPEAWVEFPLDPDSREDMVAALRRVGDVKRLPADAAQTLGFAVGDGTDGSLVADAEGQVEIPRWRHAMISFPHPLLEQGLVVLDTPGLNAIGAEPELTLSLLPNAHAVLFILAADTGVTQSDLTIWRDHVGSGAGRLAVLNKIDGLWDGLRPEKEIDAEIARQAQSCAKMLGLPSAGVFPVSAQKALVARVNGDAALLAKSRLPVLEDALARDLLPAKRDIVARGTAAEALRLADEARELLLTRQASEWTQLSELTELRGKNEAVVAQTIVKAKAEKDAYEKHLREYHAIRSIFAQLSETLFSHLGLSSLRAHARRTRDAMREARFTPQLVAAMADLFAVARENLAAAEKTIAEIAEMMEAMRNRFGQSHGIALEESPEFSLADRKRQLDELEARARSRFGGFMNLLTRDKQTLTQQFFETVASQLRRIFDHANRDAELWLRALMSPLEGHVREVQRQLKHRLDGVRRIHDAAENLEDRIEELAQEQQTLEGRLQQLGLLVADMKAAIERGGD